MTSAPATLHNGMKALPAFLFFALLGTLALWLALSGLLPSTRAILSHAPLVALSPRDAIGLPLALLCFSLAAMTLFPAPDFGPDRKRAHAKPDQRRTHGLQLWLGVAIASVFLTVVTVPITEFAASAIMANLRYLRCPAPAHERHPPLRWSLANGTCP